MNKIFIILKKELKRFFTDRKLLVTLLLPGILIYVVYSLMGGAFQKAYKPDENYEYQVYVINNNDINNQITEILKKDSKLNIKLIEDISENVEDIKEQIKSKNADLLILFNGDFTNFDVNENRSIEIYMNSTKKESSYLYSIYETSFSEFEDQLRNIYDINLNIEYDLASSNEKQASVMTMILPMLIVMLLFSGCMAVVPESIAGEKERGTISTLLITPIKRSELAIGKILSLSIISVCSALSSFIGIILSLPKLMGDENTKIIYGFKEYALLLLILIATVLLFVTILSILSAQSKSVKESGMYATPVMILVMIVSMSMMFNNSDKINAFTCLIPVYNTSLMLKSIFSFNVNILGIVITVLSNIIYTILGVFVLTKMFNSERIMYNK